MRHLLNDPFDQKDHLLANVCDYLSAITFFTNLSARTQVDKDNSDVFKAMPEPMPRPKLRKDETSEEEKPKIVFAKGRDLAASAEFAQGGLTESKLRKLEKQRLIAEGVIEN